MVEPPAKKYDAQIEELAAAFAAVSAAISTALAAAAATVTTPAMLVALRAAIAGELQTLTNVSADWIEAHLPRIYSDGAQSPAGRLVGEIIGRPERDAQALEILEGDAADLHAEAIEATAQELANALEHAINGIGVTANARLEEIRRRNIARALAQDSPVGNALDQTLADEMAEAGITFTDRAGRNWNSEAYARMVLRTHVATTLNIGTLNRGIEGGARYVRVFDGGPGDVDEPCERANGQVWHIAIAAANLTEHPNCRRSFAPLEPGYSGPVDRDLEKVAA